MLIFFFMLIYQDIYIYPIYKYIAYFSKLSHFLYYSHSNNMKKVWTLWEYKSGSESQLIKVFINFKYFLGEWWGKYFEAFFIFFSFLVLRKGITMYPWLTLNCGDQADLKLNKGTLASVSITGTEGKCHYTWEH